MSTIEAVNEALKAGDSAEALDMLLAVEDDPAQPQYDLRWYMVRPRGADLPLSVGLPKSLPKAMQWTREAWEAEAWAKVNGLRGHADNTVYRIRVVDLAQGGKTAASVPWQAGMGVAQADKPQAPLGAYGAPLGAYPPAYGGGYPMQAYGRGQPAPQVDVEALIAKASESTAKAVLAGVESRLASSERARDDDDDDGPAMSEDALVMMTVLERLPRPDQDPYGEQIKLFTRAMQTLESVMGPRPLFAKVGQALAVWQQTANPNGGLALPAPQAASVGSAAPSASGLDMATVDKAVANMQAAGLADASLLIQQLAANPEVAKQLFAKASQ